MIWWAKYSIVTTLSILYTAYIIEMYRHLTRPLKPFHHQSRKKKIRRLIIFFIAIATTVLCAYIIREFLLPRPTFDLIVSCLQATFIIPFFGAILTDRLLHAWRQKRLPYPITVLIVICTGLIAIGSNLLILYGSQETIRAAADILGAITDIITICFILVLGVLGIAYVQSTRT